MDTLTITERNPKWHDSPFRTRTFWKRTRTENEVKSERIESLLIGRYRKRDNAFVGTQFHFDLDQCAAWSYGWWQFVATSRTKKVIYFNDGRYSMQTDVHQAMAMNILYCEMPELYGFKVVRVSYREGLNHLYRAISNMEYEIKKLKEEMAKPRSQKKKNLWRVQRIKQIEKDIVYTATLQADIRSAS